MNKLIPYLSEQEIEDLNTKLANQINRDYEALLKKDEELLVVITLKGAAFFATDLLKKITVPLRMDFVRLASYGTGTKSSGTVQILKDVEEPVTNRHVLALDEIVDSGRTLKFLVERLWAHQPKSIRLGALLSKPSRREVEIPVEYLGREVEDKFLVGYGLDFGEKYRNLKEIFVLEQKG
jgi:hypoxanthine phosphoribosyltransferase